MNGDHAPAFLLKGARVLGGVPADLLLRDGVIAELGLGLS